MSALVLVVDDDPDARDLLAQAFDGRYVTLVAPDGQTGLEMAVAAKPDLVVLDAVMDGLTGFETCRRLKASPGLSDIPVIFMTGLTETEHVVEGFRAGGVDYITKPVVLDELLARVHVHLSNAQRATSARSALDIAGRSLFATDGTGTVLWSTPQAERLLTLAREAGPDDLRDALRQRLAGGADAARLTRLGMAMLQLSYLGAAGDEHFFRLSEPVEGREGAILRDALRLTTREADVLVWIARGKSNRDISEILNISARTVNKHLEQVFTKLGVENRAAAAVIATRIVSSHS